jgi:hypothetical protein
MQSEINGLADENTRLRAALETIAKYHGDEVDSACAEIARTALTAA